MKDEHTYCEKMARNGRNMVIYKGTFLSNQSLAYIIAEKLAKLQSDIASLKMHRAHAHRKFQKNGFATAHRNLLLHIATCNLLLHNASHALENSHQISVIGTLAP